MKLLLYSHSFAPNVGGVETMVWSLARGLADLRTIDNRPRFDLTVATETPAADFDPRSLPFSVVRQPSPGALWRLVEATDAVHLAGPALLPLFLAWLARKPIAVEHHGYQSVCLNGLLIHQPDGSICPGYFQSRRYSKCVRCQAAEMPWPRAFVNLLLMFPRHALARVAACNIAVSRHVLERLALPKSRVVYHGVETVDAPTFSVAEISSPQDKLCFAYVGRLVPEKGLLVLLEAAGILRREPHQFELLLIGDGPQRAQLQAVIEQTGLAETVRITGFLQGPRLAEALARVHAVVMPSLWEETAGLAAMEQLMRGKLVIASKIGGLLETVGDAGLLCEPGNAEDLMRCMREVLHDRAMVIALGLKGRDRAKSLFDRERMIDEHVAAYQQIVGHDT
jgi:glycosyltransferase involved in cell wall biosynthesis